MDFDHAPGSKALTLGHSHHVRHLSEAEIRMEMSKCDLVCANCHREREHARSMIRRMMKRTE
jgi:predicted HNH restriction endonuclease